MHGSVEHQQLLSLDAARRLKVRSERIFAIAFLECFRNLIPLTHHPLSVSIEGVGSTEIDFGTPYKGKRQLYFEVTEYNNVFKIDAKQRQYVVMEQYQQICPEAYHLMINGLNLEHPIETMNILWDIYFNELKIPVAQKRLNTVG